MICPRSAMLLQSLVLGMTLLTANAASGVDETALKLEGKQSIAFETTVNLWSRSEQTIEVLLSAKTGSSSPMTAIAMGNENGTHWSIRVDGKRQRVGFATEERSEWLPFDFSDDSIHHIQMVSKNGKTDVYVDHILLGRVNVAPPNNTQVMPLHVGSKEDKTEFFVGEIKTARVWNAALTLLELQELDQSKPSYGYPAYENLLAHLTVEDGKAKLHTPRRTLWTTERIGKRSGDFFNYPFPQNHQLAAIDIVSSAVGITEIIPYFKVGQRQVSNKELRRTVCLNQLSSRQKAVERDIRVSMFACHRWLEDSEHLERWKDLLHHDLVTQAVTSPVVDASVIEQALLRHHGEFPQHNFTPEQLKLAQDGLKSAEFMAVRKGLVSWVDLKEQIELVRAVSIPSRNVAATRVEFKDNEEIVGLAGTQDRYPCSLRFITNRQITPSAGIAPGSEPFVFRLPPGMRVAGISLKKNNDRLVESFALLFAEPHEPTSLAWSPELPLSGKMLDLGTWTSEDLNEDPILNNDRAVREGHVHRDGDPKSHGQYGFLKWKIPNPRVTKIAAREPSQTGDILPLPTIQTKRPMIVDQFTVYRIRYQVDNREFIVDQDAHAANDQLLRSERFVADSNSNNIYRSSTGGFLVWEGPDSCKLNGRRLKRPGLYPHAQSDHPGGGESKLQWDSTFGAPERPPVSSANFKGYNIFALDPRNLQANSGASKFLFKYPSPTSKDYYFSSQRSGMIVPYGLIFANDLCGDESSYTEIASSTAEYDRSWKNSVGFNIGVPQVCSFGLNASYSTQLQHQRNTRSIWTITRARQFSHALVLDKSRVQLSEGFESAVRDLARDQLAGVKPDFDRLIDAFGTHYPFAVTYGAMFCSERRYSLAGYADLIGHGSSLNANASATFEKTVSVGGNLGRDDANSQKHGRESSTDSVHNFSLGGELSANGWSARKGEEVPMMLDLRPIYELLSPLYFDDALVWTELRAQLKQRLTDLSANISKDLDSTTQLPRTFEVRVALIRASNRQIQQETSIDWGKLAVDPKTGKPTPKSQQDYSRRQAKSDLLYMHRLAENVEQTLSDNPVSLDSPADTDPANQQPGLLEGAVDRFGNAVGSEIKDTFSSPKKFFNTLFNPLQKDKVYAHIADATFFPSSQDPTKPDAAKDEKVSSAPLLGSLHLTGKMSPEALSQRFAYATPNSAPEVIWKRDHLPHRQLGIIGHGKRTFVVPQKAVSRGIAKIFLKLKLADWERVKGTVEEGYVFADFQTEKPYYSIAIPWKTMTKKGLDQPKVRLLNRIADETFFLLFDYHEIRQLDRSMSEGSR